MKVFAVIDRASRNVLGEFASVEQAAWLIDELTRANPGVRTDLRIVETTTRGAPVDEHSAETVFA